MDKQGDLGDKLNNFCFHVYAQKSLIIGENHSKVFLAALQSYKSSCPGLRKEEYKNYLCPYLMLTGVGQILGASRQLVVMEEEVEDCGNLGLKQVY